MEKCKDWNSLSEVERTPRQFRHREPDVIVIVGGIQFFHYSDILCSNCDYFESLFASPMTKNQGTDHHRDKSKKFLAEFPDRDPAEWLEVYKLLDPMASIGSSLSLDQSPCALITYQNADCLLPWFDYLGMEQHKQRCDRVLANRTRHEYNHNRRGRRRRRMVPSYATWQQLKEVADCLPLTKNTILTVIKQSTHYIIKDIATNPDQFQDLKLYLLDEECGDELWSYFIESAVAFPRSVLEEPVDRKAVVSSETFGEIAEKYRQPPPPRKKKSFFDSSSEEEEEDSSDDDDDDDDDNYQYNVYNNNNNNNSNSWRQRRLRTYLRRPMYYDDDDDDHPEEEDSGSS